MPSEKFSREELEKILRKIELLEKMGIRLKWRNILAGDEVKNFGENLVRDLQEEIAELNKKISPAGEVGGVRVLGDPVPVDGWRVRPLDEDTVEYSKGGEVWIWRRSRRQWVAPRNHPDPNPITPEGKRLGPGM